MPRISPRSRSAWSATAGLRPFDLQQRAVLAKASRMRQFALRSLTSQGFVEVAGPPHPNPMFAHASGSFLSLSAAFAFESKGVGAVVSLGTGSYLNLCEPSAGQPLALCGGPPPVLQPPATAPSAGPSPHHRKLLLSTQTSPMAMFELELVGIMD